MPGTWTQGDGTVIRGAGRVKVVSGRGQQLRRTQRLIAWTHRLVSDARPVETSPLQGLMVGTGLCCTNL